MDVLEAFRELNKIDEAWDSHAFESDNLDRHCDCLYTSDTQLKNAIAAAKKSDLYDSDTDSFSGWGSRKWNYLCEVNDALEYMLDLCHTSKLSRFFNGYSYSIKVYRDWSPDFEYYALDIKLTNNKSKISYNFIYTLSGPAQYYYIERHGQNNLKPKQNMTSVSHDNGPSWSRRPLFTLSQEQIDYFVDWLSSTEY